MFLNAKQGYNLREHPLLILLGLCGPIHRHVASSDVLQNGSMNVCNPFSHAHQKSQMEITNLSLKIFFLVCFQTDPFKCFQPNSKTEALGPCFLSNQKRQSSTTHPHGMC